MFISLMSAVVKTFKRPFSRSSARGEADIDAAPQEDPSVSVGEQWNHFLESKPINTILQATKHSHLPKSSDFWESACHDACQMWIKLEEADMLDDMNVEGFAFPILCLLLKAVFLFSNTAPRTARKLLFSEDPAINIIHAAVSCPLLPYSFAERLIKAHPGGLLESHNSHRLNPLHRLCVLPVDMNHVLYSYFSKRDSNSLDDISLVALFARSCPKAAFQVDATGSYPLFDACRARLTWSTGIGALVEATPHIVGLAGSDDGQTPFIMFAMAHSNQEMRRKADGKVGKVTSSSRRAGNKKKLQSNAAESTTKRPLTRIQEAALDLEVLETLYGLVRHDPNILKPYCCSR